MSHARRFGDMRAEMYQSGRRPASWRVSGDVWSEMHLDRLEWMPMPSAYDTKDVSKPCNRPGYVYGLPVSVDPTLPPNSVVLVPEGGTEG